MEKGEEARKSLLVYSADISFRDVAEKINAFYNNKKLAERRIRTRGTFRHTRFRVGHIRPLATSPENCKSSLKIPILLYYN